MSPFLFYIYWYYNWLFLIIKLLKMKNLSKEELLSRMEAINRSNALIYFDLDGKILGVNAIFLKAMGYGEDEHAEVVGKHHSIFVCDDYARSAEYEKFWDILRSGKYYKGEFERRKRDGSLINLQATYNPIFDETGKITKIMKVATDITAIVNSKKQVDAINKSTATITFDMKGFILDANGIFLETMGLKSNEKNQVIGKHHSIFVNYEYSKSDEYAKFWQNLNNGKFVDGIFERKRVDGSTIYLQASYNPVFDSKGNVTEVIKIATDVTESVNNKKEIDLLSKNLQVELDNSKKLKDAIEIEKNAALNDLDVVMKKSQSELIKIIVKVALSVIIGVGVVTTILYWMAMLTGKDTQIIGSTWSNMFSVLLTNAFSIVGTIMGIKYATQDDKNKK
jgi:methyl-accepting chemotaxis protein